MATAQVVIGAGFGDEGKGALTDYFSDKAQREGKDNLVVRFNGGAQAGHTVVTHDGKRHAFSHFGSGTLCGSKTYLSKHFVVNPILFAKEIKELQAKKVYVPKVFVDEECLITVPHDMLLNQFAEKAKGANKHGSCGVGFNETIERSKRNEAFCITVKDLKKPTELTGKLVNILYNYLLDRITELGIHGVVAENLEIFTNPNLSINFVADLLLFNDNIYICDSSVINQFDNVVFEGAQGLLLDQNSRYFPHVTRSNTGMKNVAEIAKEVGIKEMDLTYVSRCYATRHGAGPFPHETKEKPYQNIEEKTNQTNKYQGGFRYGHLDIIELAGAIDHDTGFAKDIALNKSLAVTCLDHLDNGNVKYVFADLQEAPINEFISQFMDLACIDNGYVSFGPTRNDIKKF